jgi:hypothetical protein
MRLDEIGLTWEFRDSAWEKRFVELSLFKERSGSCNVRMERKPSTARLGS